MRVKNLIIGAGPTGLLLGGRLSDSLIITEDIGGLINSFEKNNYTFDLGVHVYATNSDDVANLMNESGAIFVKERKTFFIPDEINGMRVPFPVQGYADRLGIMMAPNTEGFTLTGNDSFEAYNIVSFGNQFYTEFMKPFNTRVWSTPPDCMGSYWLGERVAPISATQNWGFNSSFYYAPGYKIVQTLLKKLKAQIMVGRVFSFDNERNTALVQVGNTVDEISFDTCYCTAPILTHERRNKVLVVGVGLNTFANVDDDFHWVYTRFSSIVHRVTLNSRIYPCAPSGCDALIMEIPYRETQYNTPLETYVAKLKLQLSFDERTSREVAKRLLDDAGFGIIDEKSINTVWTNDISGYPVPTLGARLSVIKRKKTLLTSRIFLCGRWGAHAYMNLQHIFKDVDAVIRASTEDDKEDYFLMPYCYSGAGGLGKEGFDNKFVARDTGRRLSHFGI